jgi:predicted transcriptional regulator
MPFDRQMMMDLIEEGLTMKEVSEELKVSPSTLREYRHVIEQEQDQTLDPFLNRIRDVMEDRDLTEKMTMGLSQDGLADTMDATEAELADLT